MAPTTRSGYPSPSWSWLVPLTIEKVTPFTARPVELTPCNWTLWVVPLAQVVLPVGSAKLHGFTPVAGAKGPPSRETWTDLKVRPAGEFPEMFPTRNPLWIVPSGRTFVTWGTLENEVCSSAT